MSQLQAFGSFPDRADLLAAVESFWCKLTMADAYKPAKRLECARVQLFKATEGHNEAQVSFPWR